MSLQPKDQFQTPSLGVESVDVWKQRAGKTCVYLSMACSLGLVGLIHLGEYQEAEAGGGGIRLQL